MGVGCVRFGIVPYTMIYPWYTPQMAFSIQGNDDWPMDLGWFRATHFSNKHKTSFQWRWKSWGFNAQICAMLRLDQTCQLVANTNQLSRPCKSRAWPSVSVQPASCVKNTAKKFRCKSQLPGTNRKMMHLILRVSSNRNTKPRTVRQFGNNAVNIQEVYYRSMTYHDAHQHPAS
jgi:hypothetical protein